MSLQSDRGFQQLTKAIGHAVRDKLRYQPAQTRSQHIQVLRDHGREIYALPSMIEVYAELAKPETTGGIVVFLERPSPAEQTRYGGGYRTVLSKTKTLQEVDRLISLVTNGVLNIEDVTILDAFPLQPVENYDILDKKKSSELLQKLLAAKRPEVVISCFKAGPHEGFIRVLQHPGVAHHTNGQCRFLDVRYPYHKFKKIDAFHPSFAFSYHADEECLAQLLELQFAKGFGEWCGVWREASWMDDLRLKTKIHLATSPTNPGYREYRNIGSVSQPPATSQAVDDLASLMNTVNLSSSTPRYSSPAGVSVEVGSRPLSAPEMIPNGPMPVSLFAYAPEAGARPYSRPAELSADQPRWVKGRIPNQPMPTLFTNDVVASSRPYTTHSRPVQASNGYADRPRRMPETMVSQQVPPSFVDGNVRVEVEGDRPKQSRLKNLLKRRP